MADKTDDIQYALERFRSNREKVQTIFDMSKTLLDKMAAVLMNASVFTSFQTALFSKDEESSVSLLQRGGSQDRPCLVIIGQTKAGKSTLINELLQGTFVAQSETPCTARVTRLCYSKEPYVRVISRDGQVLSDQKLKTSKIPEEILTLSMEDRNNEQMISAQVEAGIASEFLRSGIDVIDSPGRNENPELDKLTDTVLYSLLPLIIYVIDGRMLVTEKDVEDIRYIKQQALGIEICYVLTKLDVDEHQLMMTNMTEEQLINDKLNRAYKKLQDKGFLPENLPQEECVLFYGISLKKVREWRRKNEMLAKSKKPMQKRTKWNDRFDKFRNSLHNFVQSRLEELIIQTINVILRCHSRILSIFIDRTGDIVKHERRIRDALIYVKELENTIYETANEKLLQKKSKLSASISNFMQIMKPKIYDMVSTINPTAGMEDILENGVCSSTDILNRCIKKIHDVVIEKINTEFTHFLTDDIFKEHVELFDELLKQTEELEKDIPQTPAFLALKKTLIQNYKLSNNDFFSKTNVASKLRRFLRSIIDLFTNPISTVSGKHHVQSEEWKIEQVKRIFECIDRRKFLDIMTNDLSSFFDTAHKNFEREIEQDQNLLDKTLKLSSVERKALLKICPLLATTYMKAFAVLSKYKFNDYKVVDDDNQGIIGRGAQGIVYKVKSKSTDHIMAMKSIIVTDQTFHDIAMEVYYSSQFNSINLLSLEGVKIVPHKEDDGFTINMYMQMRPCDVTRFLKRNSQHIQTNIRQRLTIGLHTAHGIKVLHDNGLIHRDIKMQNILLNLDGTNVCLTDFGLSKPLGMQSQSGYIVGTPFYMAPEIVKNKRYGHAVDVYAFSVLLWYLFEGTTYRQPGYANSVSSVDDVLTCAAFGNMRPERLNNMSDAFWKLLNDGWASEPSERPTIDEMIRRLEEIIKEFA